jgi:undecaprenyl-diphosphatase
VISLLELDKAIFAWINTDWSNPIFDLVMPWITHLADPIIVWLWIVFIGLLAGWRFAHSIESNLKSSQQRILILKAGLSFFLYAALIYGVNAGVYNGLKHLFIRTRPFVQQTVVLRVPKTITADLQNDGSFPSGHATNAFMFAAIYTAQLQKKRFAFYFYGVATLIALSRIYLGVHYPGDVVAGACLSLIITWLMLRLQPLVSNRKSWIFGSAA